MNLKKDPLLKISFLTGLIPLVGGLGIFLTWFFARYFFAKDLNFLEPIGFFWMMGCFFVALFGLFLLLVHVIINRKKLKRNMLYSFLMITINIPTVFAVVHLQEKADRYIYIKITNNTQLDNVNFKLISNLKNKDFIYLGNQKVFPIGRLRKGESTVFYLTHEDEIFYEFKNKSKNLELQLKSEELTKTLTFEQGSPYNYSSCYSITIDTNFRIIEK